MFPIKNFQEDKPSIAGQPKKRNFIDYTKVQIMQLKAGSVILNIRYFETEFRYLIMIHKDGELYFPKMSKLESDTCKGVVDLLKIEYNTSDLQYFVGYENRTQFQEAIEKIPSFFTDSP
jgi:hypothetical protein